MDQTFHARSILAFHWLVPFTLDENGWLARNWAAFVVFKSKVEASIEVFYHDISR